MCCVGMWNVGDGAVDGRLQKLPVTMEVGCVVLECGILVMETHAVVGRQRTLPLKNENMRSRQTHLC